jgi:hypothetical protein
MDAIEDVVRETEDMAQSFLHVRKTSFTAFHKVNWFHRVILKLIPCFSGGEKVGVNLMNSAVIGYWQSELVPDKKNWVFR